MEAYTKRMWMAVAAVVSVVIVIWLFTALLYGMLIVFAGILLGVFLAQLSGRLARLTKLPYKGAYAVVVVSLVVLAGVVIVLMGAQILSGATEFVEQLWQASERLQEQVEGQAWWESLQRMTGDMLVGPEALTTATMAVTTVFAVLGGGVLVSALGFYFGLRPDWYRAGLLSLVPPGRRQRATDVLDMIGETLWYWILGRLAAMLVIGVGWGVGLWLLGVPMAATLGVFAGLMDFIPNIGPFIALIPALLLSFQEGAHTALYVLILFLVLQTLEGYVLAPLIEQHQVALPPGVTLSNQLLFSLWAGFLGLLLATPLAVVITILLREFYVKDALESQPVGHK